MSIITEKLTFKHLLTADDLREAREFSQQHQNAEKSKQVYLNTLAVLAVEAYFDYLGIVTELSNSSSWNFISQCVMNVADIEIIGKGKLECRYILPNQEFCHVPPEVWEDRIGYLVVEINEEKLEANLLGFCQQVEQESLPLSRLQSLDELLDFIYQLDKNPINLSQWLRKKLDEAIEAGWQTLEEIYGSTQQNWAFNLMNAADEENGITLAKKLYDWRIELGIEAIVLLVKIKPEADGKVGIQVRVTPDVEAIYLPSNLKLIMRSNSGKTLAEVESR
ncbi:MAG: DUF1822 family protein, partial [Xenococcus sp. (in: cyanobacteria)]